MSAAGSGRLGPSPAPTTLVLAVTEGSAKSVEIAKRACRMAEELGVKRIIGIANRTVS